MPNVPDILDRVCTEEERRAARREGELAGLKYRAAQLCVIALDAQLAVAVAENDKGRAEQITAQLKRSLLELVSIREFEARENIRIAQLISSISEQN